MDAKSIQGCFKYTILALSTLGKDGDKLLFTSLVAWTTAINTSILR